MSGGTEQEAMVGGGFGTMVTAGDTTASAEKSILRWIITNLGRVGCFLFLAVAVIITLEVVMRFVFSKPTMWVTELSSLLTIIASFLLFAYTLQEKGHTRVDFITAMLSRKSVYFLELFTTLLGLRLLRDSRVVRDQDDSKFPGPGGSLADPPDTPLDPPDVCSDRRRFDVSAAPQVSQK